MGPPSSGNASNDEDLTALCAFPSPASINDSLTPPTLEFALRDAHAPCSPIAARHGLLDTPNILPAQPGDVQIKSVVTPLADETMPEPDMNLVVGGALAPVHANLPPRAPPRRARPAFRLPSFQSLGIALPTLDRFGLDSSSTSTTTEGIQHPLDTPYGGPEFMGAFSEPNFEPYFEGRKAGSDSKIPGGRAVQSPIRQVVDTLTPPAEPEHSDWSSMRTVISAMDSPSTDPGNIAPSEARRQSGAAASTSGLPSQISTGHAERDDGPQWIRGGISVLVDNLRLRSIRNDSLRMISHALPSPSPTGHVFSEVLGAISNSTPGSASSPMTWINVFHAIPGKFNLQDLPRSPPSTPGPAIGGEDYFTEKVFDSAVSIADYQQDLSELPRSPCPVVPPNSIDVSIVERYIPPSSCNEFATMFDTNGPSILIDRLIELSPNNSSLLFIYPTRAGAETFMREYLGPILDPILRSLAVTEGFPAELNRNLGSMAAADKLPDYENLHHRMATLCARLTQRSSAAERFHGRKPHLTLSYASKQYVQLSPDAWARDWFVKQEKARIREAIAKHSREAQKIPRKDFGGERRSAADLLQELLTAVERKASESAKEARPGVEVSVFVITRSS